MSLHDNRNPIQFARWAVHGARVSDMGSRRWLLRRFVRLTPILVSLALPAIWLAWRCCSYLVQNRIISALESQGAGFILDNPKPLLREFGAACRGYRDVSMLVFETPVDLNLAAHLQGLVAIHFLDTVIREDDIAPISRMHNLRTLTMTRVRVAASVWRQIARLGNLRSLMIDSVEVGHDGLHSISSMVSLQRLYLQHCDISDDAMTKLKELQNLHAFGLRGSRITERGLAVLRGLPKLEVLDLGECGLNDKSLESLVFCNSFRDLDLSGNPITDNAFRSIELMKNLVTLHLNRTRITDAGLRGLQTRPAPMILYVRDTRVTEDAAACLRSLGFQVVTEH